MSQRNVPFFLLDSDPRQVRALFTVPAELAVPLSRYPVLCRSSCFDLVVLQDDNDQQEQQPEHQTTTSSHTVFLSTTFESPTPEQTALTIAQTLAVRMDHHLATPPFFSIATDVLKNI